MGPLLREVHRSISADERELTANRAERESSDGDDSASHAPLYARVDEAVSGPE
jgi:hypothetical protein